MANTRQKALAKVDTDIQEPHAEVTQFDIKSMIYVIRNQQVMIDSDLAMLYQVETKRLNEAVEETEFLRSQIATLNEDDGRWSG